MTQQRSRPTTSRELMEQRAARRPLVRPSSRLSSVLAHALTEFGSVTRAQDSYASVTSWIEVSDDLDWFIDELDNAYAYGLITPTEWARLTARADWTIVERLPELIALLKAARARRAKSPHACPAGTMP